jgi:hypothetical protein
MGKTLKHFKIRRSRSKSGKNNKSKRVKHIYDEKNGKYGIWGKFGSVYSPKLKHYIRIGGTPSFNVIRDELERDEEWYERVKFMAYGRGPEADRYKTLLE